MFLINPITLLYNYIKTKFLYFRFGVKWRTHCSCRDMCFLFNFKIFFSSVNNILASILALRYSTIAKFLKAFWIQLMRRVRRFLFYIVRRLYIIGKKRENPPRKPSLCLRFYFSVIIRLMKKITETHIFETLTIFYYSSFRLFFSF